MSGLRAEGLRVEADGRVLVDGVGFAVRTGEVVALVGESGSGKSLTLRAVLDLVPARPGRTAGRVWLDGVERSGRSLRGEVGLLFQDARASLDPLRTVGAQLAASARLAGTPVDAPALLARLGFTEPARDADRYPHELSGGMAQRAALALALARNGRFLLCDEPTSALDAHLQVELVRLLRGLDRVGILFVTHDLRLLPGFADRILVMEGGRIVEEAPDLARLSGAGRRLVASTAAIAAPGFGRGAP